eukprot:6195455-Pleurochrysis_carterae.AAC.1
MCACALECVRACARKEVVAQVVRCAPASDRAWKSVSLDKWERAQGGERKLEKEGQKYERERERDPPGTHTHTERERERERCRENEEGMQQRRSIAKEREPVTAAHRRRLRPSRHPSAASARGGAAVAHAHARDAHTHA